MRAGDSTRRLFFALKPDASVRARIATVQRRLSGGDGRPVPAPRLHATLLFLGDQPAATLDDLRDIADGLEFPPCAVSLDRCGYFPRARVAWLGPSRVPSELETFRRQLVAAVEAAGRPFDAHPWRMHVTLYRDLRKRPETITFDTVEWHPRDFCLLESVQGKSGLRYLRQGRWPR